MHKNADVYAPNVSKRGDAEEYPNILSQIWFAAGDFFRRDDVTLPPHEELEADLLAPEYTFDA
ncbi:MAG: hypothetical protein AAF938_10475 [Myxococcota bacterium]